MVPRMHTYMCVIRFCFVTFIDIHGSVGLESCLLARLTILGFVRCTPTQFICFWFCFSFIAWSDFIFSRLWQAKSSHGSIYFTSKEPFLSRGYLLVDDYLWTKSRSTQRCGHSLNVCSPFCGLRWDSVCNNSMWSTHMRSVIPQMSLQTLLCGSAVAAVEKKKGGGGEKISELLCFDMSREWRSEWLSHGSCCFLTCWSYRGKTSGLVAWNWQCRILKRVLIAQKVTRKTDAFLRLHFTSVPWIMKQFADVLTACDNQTKHSLQVNHLSAYTNKSNVQIRVICL